MNPAHLQRLVAENLVFLKQLTTLLETVSSADYQRLIQGRHSLGRHLRHIVDHYQALLAALAISGSDRLDYETRAREQRLEQSPEAGLQALARIRQTLEQLSHEQLTGPLQMAYPCAAGPTPDDPVLSVSTTAERELVFLTSHTVHHMALIGLLAPHLEMALPDTFGVHPSTLRHWARQSPVGTRQTAEVQ